MFLGCRYTNFTSTAGAAMDILMQHPLYHRRPYLPKEYCDGEFPDWTIDPSRVIKGKTYEMEDSGSLKKVAAHVLTIP